MTEAIIYPPSGEDLDEFLEGEPQSTGGVAVPWPELERRAAGRKTVLHVGCGPIRRNLDKLNPVFADRKIWHEVRLDIDPNVKPDVVASITEMTGIPDQSVDAVWSSHNLEHLYFHEVAPALREFWRVLKPGGFALVTLPDLGAVARLILEKGAEAPLIKSGRGEHLSPLDMLYGWRTQVAAGRTAMAHKCGFTNDMLGAALTKAGFRQTVLRRGREWDLWALSYKDTDILDREMLTRAIPTKA